MPRNLGPLLRDVVERELPNLQAIADVDAGVPQRDGGWSRKQELGHLIDSATNNRMRFVRATLDGEYRDAGYDQERWVELHSYNELAWKVLVDTWYGYNSLLAHLVERIPAERLDASCYIASNPRLTLGFVIEDYVLHMQHHLDHILAREQITKYSDTTAAKNDRG